MSGIAGILRRDGREVPEKWIVRLEKSLLHSGMTPKRFEDSIPIQSGDLHITLLGSDPVMQDSTESSMMVIDGSLEGECALAMWNQHSLELELERRGVGCKSLYWLDLADAGDGLLFSTNPLPLLQICHDVGHTNDYFSQGVREYLQFGIAIEGGSLLAPLYAVPPTPPTPLNATEPNPIQQFEGIHRIECDFSTSIAEDILALIQILGTPYSDITLLSKYWQYQVAKRNGKTILEGLKVPKQQKTTVADKLKESHLLKRLLAPTKGEMLKDTLVEQARRIQLHAIASHIGADILVSTSRDAIDPIDIPLDSWFRNPQSSLGQLAGETFSIADNFEGLPLEQSEVIELFNQHQQNGAVDYSEQLFALLTLVLWHRQVHAS